MAGLETGEYIPKSNHCDPGETIVTDADGQFVLTYTKASEEVYVYASASGYASRRIVVRMKMSGMQNVTIELNSGSRLAGAVMDPNNRPIQGAEVSISGLSDAVRVVVTDSAVELVMIRSRVVAAALLCCRSQSIEVCGMRSSKLCV